jgi:hypothetical protein
VIVVAICIDRRVENDDAAIPRRLRYLHWGGRRRHAHVVAALGSDGSRALCQSLAVRARCRRIS